MITNIDTLNNTTFNELDASNLLSSGNGVSIIGAGTVDVMPNGVGLAIYDKWLGSYGAPQPTDVVALTTSVVAEPGKYAAAAYGVVSFTETNAAGVVSPATGGIAAKVVGWNNTGVLLEELPNFIPGPNPDFTTNGDFLILTDQNLSVNLGSFSSTGTLEFTTTGAFPVLTGAIGCFAAGTRLRAENGETLVETLQAGDRVWSVLSQDWQTVVWVGQRTVDCARHPQPQEVWPVRVRAGAFGPNLPVCDLWLSPDHAVFIHDVLIPVRYLVNGDSIAQFKWDTVDYYHVELKKHGILLAEGLTVESYLDAGERSNFANGGGAVALHPVFATAACPGDLWEMRGCAPLVVTGPQLDAARATVAKQAVQLDDDALTDAA